MKKMWKLILIFIGIIFLIEITEMDSAIKGTWRSKYFTILSNPDNKEFMDELEEYAKSEKIKLMVEYKDDLEAIDELEENGRVYDAVWMSNSTWLYMLNGVTISNSKSVSINPIVFGIKKSKAESLGFVDKDVYNKDIVNAIKSKKLNYVMSSVTKTNTGLTAYLGFLNALAGSPETLTTEMLENNTLKNNLKSLFSGVSRVSGTDAFLENMFLNSDEYEAVIATESSLISINKRLTQEGKEPLYLIYPVDGVSINDSPFAYVDNKQEKLDYFLKLQSFLLSNESQESMEKLGKRTWYGGIKENADSASFKKEWGIDTSKYLNSLKYPSKVVMDKALNLYVEEFRKPSVTAFCLDYSGSMYGDGAKELTEAMNFILNYDEASKEKIQFSSNDRIYVLPFSDYTQNVWKTDNGKDTNDLINNISRLSPYGGTNIYDCSIQALKVLYNYSDDYTKTVILMTDGHSNVGTYSDLREYYVTDNKIPIYSIMFGNAQSAELQEIARLSNAKVFDGRSNLLSAFKEVRSYN